MEPLLRDATREIIVVKLDFQGFKSYVTLPCSTVNQLYNGIHNDYEVTINLYNEW